jgi:outer membrane protein
MKRCSMLVVGLVILLIFPLTAFGEGKIAVVDLQKCIRDSVKGKQMYDKLKKTKDEMQKRLDKKQEELVRMKEELDKQGMMLSFDAREDKEKEFERNRREFKYFYDDLTEEMRKAEAEARNEILKELEKVVMEIGEKGKYSMIFERRSSGLMYVENPLEITDQVIKAYDKLGAARK